MFVEILFYAFAAVLVASGLGVITARNPVHSALFLVLAFFTSAAIWLLLEAEFLAIVLVLVYVGAVMLLFLFVVMMLDVDFASLRSGFTKNLPFGVLVALVLLAEIIIALSARNVGPGTGVIPTATQPNVVALGEMLYSRYLFPFEIAGLILLVAMIGAIVLTHRSRGDVRGQNVSKQIGRRPRDAVKNMQPGVGEGMEL